VPTTAPEVDIVSHQVYGGSWVKVAQVSFWDINGGAARAAYRIHQALRRHGVDSHHCCPATSRTDSIGCQDRLSMIRSCACWATAVSVRYRLLVCLDAVIVRLTTGTFLALDSQAFPIPIARQSNPCAASGLMTLGCLARGDFNMHATRQVIDSLHGAGSRADIHGVVTGR